MGVGTDDCALYGPGAVILVDELLSGDLTSHALVALSDAEVLTLGYQPFVAACQAVEGFAFAVLRATQSSHNRR